MHNVGQHFSTVSIVGKTTESDRKPNPTTNPNPYLVAVQYGSLAV